MPFELIQYDSDLIINHVELELMEDPPAIDGFPSTFINFQFPPIISSDSKSASWDPRDVKSYEPLMIWNGATARKITLTYTYIVVESNEGENGFKTGTPKFIRDQLQSIKGYFYRDMVGTTGSGFIPHVRLKCYSHIDGTSGLSTWILDNVQINPSGPVIKDGQDTLHLKNEVTLSMMLISQIVPLGDAVDGFVIDTRIMKKPLTKWY